MYGGHMPLIRKTVAVCDRCGASVEIDCKYEDPFTSFASEGRPWAGWMRVDEAHCLCPDCARAYREKRAEMERELKALAGIRTIEIDL